ncbi:MAG: hypothetical protein ACRD0K_26315, partial [Egibacteraceae bacterium]
GPGGYLPPRASQRARKIVLRARMGLGWPLAALAAAAVIAVAVALLLRAWSSPPPPPWVAAGPLQSVEAGATAVLPAPGLPRGALIVRAAGDVRAFTAPPVEAAYCARSGHLESAGGAVWGLDGRELGPPGLGSLERLPVRVFDGTLYVNPTQPEAAPARPGTAVAACS